MIRIKLTNNEVQRVKRAAAAKGFPWQPIAERPRTARQFLKRVEAEMAREDLSPVPAGLTELPAAA